ncbi:MAG: ATP-binding protein [Proteobacteria bacterium]|nr:ATP-binding protein [Pseudomonadota bacterium]
MPQAAIEKDAEARARTVKGVKNVAVIMTAQRSGPVDPKSKKPSHGIDIPVKNIIAVASGKGGVGKSTVAVNLAAALSLKGLKVGLLDADIYGPSLPRLTATKDRKPERINEKIIPIQACGLSLMSMGYLVDEASPMIWRGPMVQSAVQQLLRDVDWSGLDVLVLDLPPGTGDVQLTLAQKVQLTGAIIVSTPQDIALIDARKGLEMFRKTNVPILGIVENMSHFCCPNCGTRSDVFGHGGARLEAEKAGVPFLGEIPLHASIREQSDAGVPVVIAAPESQQAKAFTDIASLVIVSLAVPSQVIVQHN